MLNSEHHIQDGKILLLMRKRKYQQNLIKEGGVNLVSSVDCVFNVLQKSSPKSSSPESSRTSSSFMCLAFEDFQYNDQNLRIACGENPAYIPTSVNELLSSLDMVNNSAKGFLSQKLRKGLARTEPFTWPCAGKDGETL